MRSIKALIDQIDNTKKADSLCSNYSKYLVDAEKATSYQNVSLISITNTRKGTLWVDVDSIQFYDDLKYILNQNAEDSKPNLTDFFTYVKRPFSNIRKIYSVRHLMFAFRRNFIMQRNSLELYFKTKKSLTLEF